MNTWTEDELVEVGNATELELASKRPDGTLRQYTTMWVVRVGQYLYVRSAYGPENPWFVRAKKSAQGRIRTGSVERDVSFAEADPEIHPSIDTAYRSKYEPYADKIVGSVTGAHARPLTIKLEPLKS